MPAAIKAGLTGLPGVYELPALGRGICLNAIHESVDDDVRIVLQEGLVIADGCPVGPSRGPPGLVAVEEAWLGSLGANEDVCHLVQGDDLDAVLGELVRCEGGGDGGGDLCSLEGTGSCLSEAYQLELEGKREGKREGEEGGRRIKEGRRVC